MLVTCGFGGKNSTEIIDLQSSNSTCQSFPGFYDRWNAAGGLLSKEIPIICGGADSFSETCSTFKDGNWTISHQLSEKRKRPAITSSPFPNKPEGLFMLGGEYFSSPSTADFLTKEGVESVLPNFPHHIENHCLVLFNSTTVMAIGGYQGEEFSGGQINGQR